MSVIRNGAPLAAAAMIGFAGCGGGTKMPPEQAARAFAAQTTNPLRTDVVCRKAGDRGPGWDYECWYTYLVDGEPVRTNTFIKVDEDSITDHDPS